MFSPSPCTLSFNSSLLSNRRSRYYSKKSLSDRENGRRKRTWRSKVLFEASVIQIHSIQKNCCTDSFLNNVNLMGAHSVRFFHSFPNECAFLYILSLCVFLLTYVSRTNKWIRSNKNGRMRALRNTYCMVLQQQKEIFKKKTDALLFRAKDLSSCMKQVFIILRRTLGRRLMAWSNRPSLGMKIARLKGFVDHKAPNCGWSFS